MIRFEVYGVPQPAGSKRWLPRGGKVGGRPIVVDSSRSSRPWKQDVAQVAQVAMTGREILAGPLELELVFYATRPRSHYGARGLRPSAPSWPAVRPDVLKLARAVEDALTGIVYRDDAQIVVEHLTKRYGEPARVEVAVRELLLIDAPAVAAVRGAA